MDTVAKRTLASAIDMLQQQSRMSQYYNDPVLFAKDVLGIEAWSKQRDIMRAVQEHDHVAVRSCHGSGKSFVAAIIACWWLATRPPHESIVVTTAPTYPQIHAILWEDLRKFVHIAETRYNEGKSPLKLPGYITQGDEWKTEDGVLIGFGRKPADGNMHAFNGIHRRHVLVIADESCGIREELFTAVEAITTTEGSRILAIGNPDDPATEFNKMFSNPVWHKMSVSSFDSPNFTVDHKKCTEEKCVLEMDDCSVRRWFDRYKRDADVSPDTLPLLPNKEWVEQRRMAWGTESPRWKSKVLGEFPTSTVNTLFSQNTLNIATEKTIKPARSSRVILGVDLARFGEDYSVIYKYEDGQVRLVDSWGGKADEQPDGMESAMKVNQWALSLGAAEVRVDSLGLGGPIMDRIVQLSDGGYQVYAMNASRPSPDQYRWLNARAWWYDKAREKMFSGKIDIDVADVKLFQELEAIQYHFNNNKKALQIESKEDMEKRGLKSPDFADAAIYAMADLEDMGELGYIIPGQKFSMNPYDYLDEGWGNQYSPY